MGTISDKLEYLNDTKTLLKQKINNLGGDITDQTTFREYADKLQTIYDNAPKTDYAEGSNITLSNCLKGKLDFEDDKVGYGDTTQESTTGKQLFDYTTISSLSGGTNNNGVVTSNTYSTSSTANIIINYGSTISVSTGDTVYFSCDIKLNSGSTGTFNNMNDRYNGGTTKILQPTLSTTKQRYQTSFAYSSNTTLGSILIQIGSLVGSVEISNIMISKNSNATFEKYTNGPAPNPTYPFPVQVVTGEQEVTIRGKNKLKINDVTLTSNGVTLTVQDNYFILNGTNNGTESVFQLSNYITPFKTNSNTKLKAFQISGTASGNLLNTFFRTYSNWANQVNINFTQTTMSSYSAELTYNNCMLALAGGTYTDYKIGIMVADNLTSDDTFENYITPITKTLNLGNIELAKIGTYRDYIWTDRETGKWYKHSANGKVVLNGTEEWSVTQTVASYRFRTSVSGIKSSSSNADIPQIYCNELIKSSLDNIWSNGGNCIGIFPTAQDVAICLRDLSINTVDKFKTFLTNNNAIVYYQLITATDTEITDTSLINQLEEIYNIMSNNGTTIIEIAGTLPMIIKARALKGE